MCSCRRGPSFPELTSVQELAGQKAVFFRIPLPLILRKNLFLLFELVLEKLAAESNENDDLVVFIAAKESFRFPSESKLDLTPEPIILFSISSSTSTSKEVRVGRRRGLSILQSFRLPLDQKILI